LSENSLPEPRCVKIDAEGAEIRILKGCETGSCQQRRNSL
jgi:FkbM family methyltransferase